VRADFPIITHYSPIRFKRPLSIMNRSTSKNIDCLVRPLILIALVGGLLLWSYWTTLAELAQLWSHDPQYSHGYLVPAFAVYLLWQRRHKLNDVSLAWDGWGLLLLALGTLLRMTGTFFFLPLLDSASLLLCLAGLCVLFAGRRSLNWSWPALGFLLFMLPLPYRIQTALAQPLQNIATWSSTYLLQTIGFPTLAEGNIIHLNETRIGVIEACNGLSMLITFFALSAAVAILIRGHWVHRALIVLSAVPIALAANIARIVTTAILHETVGSGVANFVFHDVAGWFMMPLALSMMGLEWWLLRHLLVELPRPTKGRLAKGSAKSAAPSVNGRRKRSGSSIPVSLSDRT
jgi:exosortase